jgi:hypothetical protein
VRASNTPAARTRQHTTTNSLPLCLIWQSDLDAPACCLQNFLPDQLLPTDCTPGSSGTLPSKARAPVELSRRLHVKIDFPAKSHDSKARPRPTTRSETCARPPPLPPRFRTWVDPLRTPPRCLRVHRARHIPSDSLSARQRSGSLPYELGEDGGRRCGLLECSRRPPFWAP